VLATHLLCPIIVLRVILKPAWLDESKRINAHAFVHDPARHPDGLSVNVALDTNVEQWLSSFKSSYGADTLHCGRIRRLGLEVGHTEADLEQDVSHAVIVGLPSQDEDPQRAEDLATELARIARTFDRTRRRMPR
jgi:hypothetical protein